MGCVLVKKNKVISTGFNSTKTHPIQKMYNKERYECDTTPHTIHAEVSAISHVIHKNINWSNVEVYIYREHKNGNLAMARPCKACMKLIQNLGIKRIHYTTSEGYATEIFNK